MQFEDMAHVAAADILVKDAKHVPKIQVLLKSDELPVALRDVKVCFLRLSFIATL